MVVVGDAIFRFMHSKLIDKVQGGDADAAWAWAFMLTHHAKRQAGIR